MKNSFSLSGCSNVMCDPHFGDHIKSEAGVRLKHKKYLFPFSPYNPDWKCLYFNSSVMTTYYWNVQMERTVWTLLQDISFVKFGDIFYLDLIFCILLRCCLLHCQRFMRSNRMQKEGSTVRILVAVFWMCSWTHLLETSTVHVKETRLL